MEGAKRRFLGNGNYQQGTAIIIKIFWWRNVNCRELKEIGPQADGGGEQQLPDTAKLMSLRIMISKRQQLS